MIQEIKRFEELTKQNNKLRVKFALLVKELKPKEQNKIFNLVNELINNEIEQEELCE